MKEVGERRKRNGTDKGDIDGGGTGNRQSKGDKENSKRLEKQRTKQKRRGKWKDMAIEGWI